MAILNQHPAFGQTANSKIREFPINDSKFLSHVKYDPTNLQCIVSMKGGGEYTYFMVFPMVIDQWMQAPSKGQFYAKSIRGKYKSQRLINKTTNPRGGKNGNYAGSQQRSGHARTKRRQGH